MNTALIDIKMIQYNDDYEFVQLINGIKMREEEGDKSVLLVFQPVDEDLHDYPDFAYDKKEENDVIYFRFPCLKRKSRMIDFDYFRSLFTEIWYKEFLRNEDFLYDNSINIIIDISSEEDNSKFVTKNDLRRFAAIAMNEMRHLVIQPRVIAIYAMAKEIKISNYNIPQDLFRESFEYVGKRDVRSKKDKKKKKKGKKK